MELRATFYGLLASPVILNNGLAMEYPQNTRNTKLDFELEFLHIQFAVAAA